MKIAKFVTTLAIASLAFYSCSNSDGDFSSFSEKDTNSTNADGVIVSEYQDNLYTNSSFTYSYMEDFYDIPTMTTSNNDDLKTANQVEITDFANYDRQKNRGSYSSIRRKIDYVEGTDSSGKTEVTPEYTYITETVVEVTDTYELTSIYLLKNMDDKGNPVWDTVPEEIDYQAYSSSDTEHLQPTVYCNFHPLNGGKVDYYAVLEYSAGRPDYDRMIEYKNEPLKASWNESSKTLTITGSLKEETKSILKYDASNTPLQEYYVICYYDSGMNLTGKKALIYDFVWSDAVDNWILQYEHAYKNDADYSPTMPVSDIEKNKENFVSETVMSYEYINGEFKRTMEAKLADGFTQFKYQYDYNTFTLPNGETIAYLSRERKYKQKTNNSSKDYNFYLCAENTRNYRLSTSGLVVFEDIIKKSDRMNDSEDYSNDSGSVDFLEACKKARTVSIR